ncbi:ubiquitin-domain-containing protein [Gigaspora margarita]|uniref:Ubiquitin-domain-containing protein n=1 Tax=Gigaspora margarita TaxID=4874 RepID=A0A8H4A8R1_GIGMA|nr:ubiquitin-domain-containing protein [Gigaspora margarita]
MVVYGYPIVNEEGLSACYVPPNLRKIKLKRSRQSFQIIGRRDEIIDWLEEHGNVVCEYNQEFDFNFSPNQYGRTDYLRKSPKGHALELPLLIFELYYEQEKEDESSHHSVIKKIFPFSGKKRMVMEIRPYIRGEEYDHHKNLIRRNTGLSGVKLRQILNVWSNSPPANRHQKDLRAACDYE